VIKFAFLAMLEKPERDAREIVDQTNFLARLFYARMGNSVRPGYDFRTATHPQEQMCWDLAVLAQRELTDTDVDDAVQELDL
jgi:hypothetical protein